MTQNNTKTVQKYFKHLKEYSTGTIFYYSPWVIKHVATQKRINNNISMHSDWHFVTKNIVIYEPLHEMIPHYLTQNVLKPFTILVQSSVCYS